MRAQRYKYIKATLIQKKKIIIEIELYLQNDLPDIFLLSKSRIISSKSFIIGFLTITKLYFFNIEITITFSLGTFSFRRV